VEVEFYFDDPGAVHGVVAVSMPFALPKCCCMRGRPSNAADGRAMSDCLAHHMARPCPSSTGKLPADGNSVLHFATQAFSVAKRKPLLCGETSCRRPARRRWLVRALANLTALAFIGRHGKQAKQGSLYIPDCLDHHATGYFI
jgi:hypothetical protein